eukprot:16447689-Heterocapsa_arctica.AAC.1
MAISLGIWFPLPLRLLGVRSRRTRCVVASRSPWSYPDGASDGTVDRSGAHEGSACYCVAASYHFNGHETAGRGFADESRAR